MKKVFLLISLICCTMLSSAQVKDQLIPLPPHSIQLTSYLENDIQNSIIHWNKGILPYSKLVDIFRYGRPQFAMGEMWGKAVRSGCMFYRYTQDPELKRILDETVKDILSTERSNGSISCVPPEKQPDGPGGDLWETKYVMLAMEEYYEWVNPDSAILKSLIKQADRIISQVGKAPKKEIVDLGWSNPDLYQLEINHIESSSLLEPFMRLYKWTGEKRFLDFAKYIIDSGGTKNYNIFEQAYNNVEPYKMAGTYPKAYEMMSIFEGLVEYYRATKETKWEQASLNLFNNIRTKEITIIGNGGCDLYHRTTWGEGWGNAALEQTNPDVKNMMETCVGVTWMKYCSQILRLTGDENAMDDIEKYIYNGLIGAMKPSGDGFSYFNALNGKKINPDGWGWKFDDVHVTCCNLNGPMGLAYIPYIAVMNSATGPVVNLYNAAKVNMTTPAHKSLNLDMETDFPQSGNVIIRVNPEKAEKFAVNLRIPAWSETGIVKVNSKEKKVVAGQYASLNRKWQKGDVIEINFDMKARLIDAPHGINRAGDNFQALIWGPIVLSHDEKIDAKYDQPVNIIADKAGIVKVSKIKPTLASTRMEFIVPTTDGDIHMVDYASVDGWDGSKICTWLPKKRDPFLQPFSQKSIWNMPIGKNAVYVYAGIEPATEAGMTVDEDIIVFTPKEPLLDIYTSNASWDRTKDRCKIDGGIMFSAPIPKSFIVSKDNWDGLTPNSGLAVLMPDGRTIKQTQPFAKCESDKATSLFTFADEDLYGDGIYGAHGGSGLSAIGGALRSHELTPTSGPIKHALKVNIFGKKNIYYDNETKGYRWPAQHADGYAAEQYYKGRTLPAVPQCRIGALLAIPAWMSIDSLGLETKPARIIAQAFQDYGAYLVDDTAWDVWAIIADWTPNSRFTEEFKKNWGFSFIEKSLDTPWTRDMRRLFTNLYVVDNNTAETIGGGGEPRVPLAQPLTIPDLIK